MSRRTTTTLEQDSVAALSEALGRIGVVTNVVRRKSSDDKIHIDAVTEAAGQRFEIEVSSVVTAAQGTRLAESANRDVPLIVVADRIATEAKRSLREAGVNFFDRRGELRIVSRFLFIDTVFEPAFSLARSRSGPLNSQVAKEVAIVCLLTPNRHHGVRETARHIGRTPSAVSKALAALKDDGLLTKVGEAVVPDLFYALLMVWRRQPVMLARLPDPAAHGAELLALDYETPYTIGWTLTDTRAAASWGMPIVTTSDYPPDFYVPSESALFAALSHLGETNNPASRACTVALAPVRLACLHRVDHSRTTGEQWPVANHIIVALDIAQDQTRGLEALDQWNPAGIARAW